MAKMAIELVDWPIKRTMIFYSSVNVCHRENDSYGFASLSIKGHHGTDVVRLPTKTRISLMTNHGRRVTKEVPRKLVTYKPGSWTGQSRLVPAGFLMVTSSDAKSSLKSQLRLGANFTHFAEIKKWLWVKTYDAIFGWLFTSINPICFDVHERCQGFDPLPYCS